MITESVLSGLMLLACCTFLIWASLRLVKLEKYNRAVLFLVCLSVLLGFYMAATPYLQPWDERYHALVAKNLLKHPLLPTLYDNPILPFDYKMWAGNNVWVHKQPVTLWGIALSMKVFGTNVLAVRLPSILMSGASVYVIYLIGKELFRPRVGYFASFFFAINGLVLELVGGRMATDHVDIFFMFFVGLAVLSAVYYAQTRKFWWNILCGLFVGMAILCKWLPALIVLPVWLALVLHYKHPFRRFFLHGLILVVIIAIVVLPWQFYIYAKFPLEATWEGKYNVMHLFQDLEKTGKPFYYYLDVMRVSYGELIYIPLFWIFMRAVKLKRDGRLWGILIWGIVPYIFFSFSATKLQAYTLFSAGALFLITALFLDELIKGKIKVKREWLKYALIALLLALPVRYSLERIKPFNGLPQTPQWQRDIERFSAQIEDESKTIVFNTEYPIEYMFHTDVVAYRGVPINAVLDSLSRKGYRVYIVSEGNWPEKYIGN